MGGFEPVSGGDLSETVTLDFGESNGVGSIGERNVFRRLVAGDMGGDVDGGVLGDVVALEVVGSCAVDLRHG